MTALRNRARRNFLWAVGVGVAASFVTTFSQSRAALSVGLPLAVMAVYWLSIQGAVRKTPLDETFADSMYYLGFLFTLSSLSATLIALLGRNGGDEAIVTMLANLGTALTTTLAGLGARTVRRTYIEPYDAENDADLSLTAATNDFTFEVRSLVDGLKVFRQEVAGSFTSMQSGVTDASVALSDSLVEMRAEVNARVELQRRAFDSSLAVLKRRNEAIEKELSAFDAAMLTFTTASDASEAFADRSKRASEELNEVITSYRKQVTAIDEITTATSHQLAAIRHSIAGFDNITAKATLATDRIRSASEQSQLDLQALHAEFKRVTAVAESTVRDANSATTQLITALAQGAQQIARELNGHTVS